MTPPVDGSALRSSVARGPNALALSTTAPHEDAERYTRHSKEPDERVSDFSACGDREYVRVRIRRRTRSDPTSQISMWQSNLRVPVDQDVGMFLPLGNPVE